MAETFCWTEDKADGDMCKSRRTEILYLGANLETVKASERNVEVNNFLGNYERNRSGIEHFIKKSIYTSIPKLAGITIMTKNPFELFNF